SGCGQCTRRKKQPPSQPELEGHESRNAMTLNHWLWLGFALVVPIVASGCSGESSGTTYMGTGGSSSGGSSSGSGGRASGGTAGVGGHEYGAGGFFSGGSGGLGGYAGNAGGFGGSAGNSGNGGTGGVTTPPCPDVAPQSGSACTKEYQQCFYED